MPILVEHLVPFITVLMTSSVDCAQCSCVPLSTPGCLRLLGEIIPGCVIGQRCLFLRMIGADTFQLEFQGASRLSVAVAGQNRPSVSVVRRLAAGYTDVYRDRH